MISLFKKSFFQKYSPLLKTGAFMVFCYLFPTSIHYSWLFILFFLAPEIKKPERRMQLMGALAILGIFGTITLFMNPSCHGISNAEKGVTSDEILMCKVLSLYHPTGARLSGTFSGIPIYFQTGLSLLSVFAAVICIVILILQDSKVKKTK